MSLFALAALLGTLLPLLIAVVQREHWPKQVRTLVALLLALIAAGAIAAGKDQWHGLDQTSVDAYATALAGIVTTTWGSYHGLWKQLGIAQWIERVTTWSRTHRDVVVDQALKLLADADPADKAKVTAALTAPVTQQTST